MGGKGDGGGPHLFLHPVVLIDGVLILGRRDAEEGGHPLAQVVAGWEETAEKLRRLHWADGRD